MTYNQLSPEAKVKAMENYIKEFAPYEDIGEPTGDDITENGVLFSPDGEIIGIV